MNEPIYSYVRGKGWVYETGRQLKRPEVNQLSDFLSCKRCGYGIGSHNYAPKYHGTLWEDDILTCPDDGEPGLF